MLQSSATIRAAPALNAGNWQPEHSATPLPFTPAVAETEYCPEEACEAGPVHHPLTIVVDAAPVPGNAVASIDVTSGAASAAWVDDVDHAAVICVTAPAVAPPGVRTVAVYPMSAPSYPLALRP